MGFVTFGLIFILFILTLVVSYFAYQFFFSMEADNKSFFEVLSIDQNESQDNNKDLLNDNDETDFQIFDEVQEGAEAPDPWDGSERVTLLIMGLDARDISQGVDYGRTDTMIVMSLDPVNKTAGVISVPRDLWVIIPGFAANKINSAYTYGEGYHLPGGGAGLAMATVEQTIGIPIDYYAIIDFDAFISFIDLIGGVKIDIKEPIKVDPIGPKIPRTLAIGMQTLPGNIALAYARDRYSGGGDFARSERQQQVIMGIFERIVSFEMLPHLIANAGSIYGSLSNGIDTNLPLEDAIKLARVAIMVSKDDIRLGVIGESHVTYGRSPKDLSILIPRPDRIRTLRDEIFAIESPYKPLTVGNIEEKVQLEKSNLHLVDATGDPEFFNQTTQYLIDQGMTIASIAESSYVSNQTSITDYTGNPYTMSYLVYLFNINSQKVHLDYQSNSSIDVELFIGTDWDNINPLQ